MKFTENMDNRLEKHFTCEDLEKLKGSFMRKRNKVKLCLTKEQFVRTLCTKLTFGSRSEFSDLFEKIDVTRQGLIDWDGFSEYMLLGMYEKDNRVPSWRNLITLKSPHKHAIRRIAFLKTTRKYLVISKEGTISTWNTDLKLQRSLRTSTDSCKPRDVFVTHFVPMLNVNKAALSFTSKEIAIYDLSSKAEFSCQYKIRSLPYTPLCLDYRYNPDNANEACLVFGDVCGYIHAVVFNTALTTLFDRQPGSVINDNDMCMTIPLHDMVRGRYKTVAYTRYLAHDREWVRQVKYSRYLECFISCATCTQRSIVIGWMEKRQTFSNQSANSDTPTKKEILRTSVFSTKDGVSAFDYSKRLNLIASAGVSHNVCLWNPYVTSRPNGELQGHTASVTQVQFIRHRGQLISLAQNKVLRIWDVHLQACIYQFAGKFPKSPNIYSAMLFDEGTDRSGRERNRLFVSFNEKLMMIQMKPENKDRILSHDNPLVTAVYNSTYNQVISICQGGTMAFWMIETGQKVKQFTGCHGKAEITCLIQNPSHTQIFTGSTDGTVKIWDFNGICFHTMFCAGNQAAEIGQIVILKRSVIVLGWTRSITVFRNEDIERNSKVQPCEWKGGDEHADDILFGVFQPPYTLATASYDGEIIVWNTNSEAPTRHMAQRMNTKVTSSHHVTNVTNGNETDHTLSNSKLLLLETRKGNSGVGGANLISCGGSGFVRFWNCHQGTLMAEYIAHTGSITMATDKNNRYLVTGDVDGVIKVWEIGDYALQSVPEVITSPPVLKTRFQPHSDMVNTIDLCEKNDVILVITASADCSVALWDIDGHKVGVFGQDDLWILDTYKLAGQDQKKNMQEEDVTKEPEETFVTQDISDDVEKIDDVTDAKKEEPKPEEEVWEPDPRATRNPGTYRFDAWGTTVLGKEYQESRRDKRPRRQPSIIKGLQFLNRRKAPRTVIGLYSALEMRSLTEVDMPTKPDADEYFFELEKKELDGKISKLPALADTLKTAFDERSLFPGYIREYEMRMKESHKEWNTPPTMTNKRPKTSVHSIGARLRAALHMDAQTTQPGQRPGNQNAQPTRPKGSVKGPRPKTTGSVSSKGSST